MKKHPLKIRIQHSWAVLAGRIQLVAQEERFEIMTALSDAIVAAQTAIANVQSAATAVGTYVSSGEAATALSAAETDAATAVTNIATITTALGEIATQLNAIAGIPAPVTAPAA